MGFPLYQPTAGDPLPGYPRPPTPGEMASVGVVATGGTPTTVGAVLVPLDPTAPGFQAAIAALLAAFEAALPTSDAGLPVGAWWSNGGIPTRVKVAS